MTDTEDTELLLTPVRSSEHVLSQDAGALSQRGLSGRRRQWVPVGLCGVVVLAVLGATVVPALLDRSKGDVEVAVGDEKDGFKPGWTQRAHDAPGRDTRAHPTVTLQAAPSEGARESARPPV